MLLSHHRSPVNSSEYPRYLSRWCHNISQNIASNSHCFGHTNSRARSPCKFKRVHTRVHRRNGGQSYHRSPVNSSEFLVSKQNLFSYIELVSKESGDEEKFYRDYDYKYYNTE